MNVQNFLELLKKPDSFDDYSVLCFSGKTYPALFFSRMFRYIKQQKSSLVMRTDLESTDIAHQSLPFETSFLGQKVWYWMGDTTVLHQKKSEAFFEYCQRYTGPHLLIYFTTSPSLKLEPTARLLHVDLDLFDLHKDAHIFDEVLYDNAGYVKVIERYSKVTKGLTLEHACLVYQYFSCIGKGVDEFISSWLSALIPSEQSLFTLSTHFFFKK